MPTVVRVCAVTCNSSPHPLFCHPMVLFLLWFVCKNRGHHRALRVLSGGSFSHLDPLHHSRLNLLEPAYSAHFNEPHLRWFSARRGLDTGMYHDTIYEFETIKSCGWCIPACFPLARHFWKGQNHLWHSLRLGDSENLSGDLTAFFGYRSILSVSETRRKEVWREIG